MKRKIVPGIAGAALALGLTVGLAAAADVTLLTPPLASDLPIYYDANRNGLHESAEFMGRFDVYDGAADLTFSWVKWQGATAYRVSMIQYPLPYVDGRGGSVETKVAHHWFNNPNGLQFTMGSFGFDEPICYGCVTILTVTPEMATQYFDPTTGQYEYEYTPLGPAVASEPFVLQQMPGPGENPPADVRHRPVCGDFICEPPEAKVGEQFYCQFDCGVP